MPDYAQTLACITDRRLQLILLPTEACNFRCVYCYEDFRLRKMRPEVVRGVKRLLERRVPGLERLHLSWFGGEPLLALPVVEDILHHVGELRRAYPDLEFTSDATTNGYRLDAATFRRLYELGVTGYQVTFDGPRQWHDRKRLRADGAGTFDVIWSNLAAISSAAGEFGITVRLHVDAENRAAIGEFVSLFRETFGHDPRFSLFLKRVERLGGPNDDLLPVLDHRDVEAAVGEAQACAKGEGVSLTVEGTQPSICYAARTNAYVVRADGRLNKCTVALRHPANDVGSLTEDGEIRLDPARAKPWMRGLFSHDAAELECPMHGLADPAPVPADTTV